MPPIDSQETYCNVAMPLLDDSITVTFLETIKKWVTCLFSAMTTHYSHHSLTPNSPTHSTFHPLTPHRIHQSHISPTHLTRRHHRRQHTSVKVWHGRFVQCNNRTMETNILQCSPLQDHSRDPNNGPAVRPPDHSEGRCPLWLQRQ